MVLNSSGFSRQFPYSAIVEKFNLMVLAPTRAMPKNPGVTHWMDYLESISAAVEASLADDSIGVPVFVRVIAVTPVPYPKVLPLGALLLQEVSGWLRSKASRLFAMSSPDSETLTVTALFPKNRSALITVGHTPDIPLIELSVFTTEGAIYHRATSLIVPFRQPQEIPDEQVESIQRAVQRSLQSQSPVPLSTTSQP